MLYYIMKHKTKISVKDAKIIFLKIAYMIHQIKQISKKTFKKIKDLCYNIIVKYFNIEQYDDDDDNRNKKRGDDDDDDD